MKKIYIQHYLGKIMSIFSEPTISSVSATQVENPTITEIEIDEETAKEFFKNISNYIIDVEAKTITKK